MDDSKAILEYRNNKVRIARDKSSIEIVTEEGSWYFTETSDAGWCMWFTATEDERKPGANGIHTYFHTDAKYEMTKEQVTTKLLDVLGL